MADDSTRGIQLNEKQLVFVLMAAGVMCGVVFLFGVLVGRNVQLTQGSSSEGTMISAPQVVSDPQPAGDAASAKPAGAAGDEYSYPKRLSQAEVPAEQLKPAASSGTGGAAPPAQPGRSAALPGQGSEGGSGPPDVPDEATTVKAQPATDAAGRPPAVKPLPDAAAGRGGEASATKTADQGPFTIQIMATPKRSEADTVARKLKARGYEARVVLPESGDKSGFRVKVGTYKTRTEAEGVATRLSAEGYKTWVTR